ncbi:MAG: hypothetical protein ACREIT_01280 [Tepidisphaeraceae bacterium]
MNTGDSPHQGATPNEAAEGTWFRQPTPREHRIAAGLFAGFGVFFVLLFPVLAGLRFRWVMLGLGAISLGRATYHAIASRRAGAGKADESTGER